MSHVNAFLCAVTLAAVAVFAADTQSKAQPPGHDIHKALDQQAEFECMEEGLNQVLDFMREEYKIPIQLDRRALDTYGIPNDTPITIHIKGVSLRSALRLMLRPLDLTYTIHDEVLQITTPEEADSRLVTIVYPVADLLAEDAENTAYTADVDSLADLISTCIKPHSWSNVGGPGTVSGADLNALQALVVSQTTEIHQQIADLLAAIRHAAALASTDQATCPIMLYDGRFGHGKAAEAISAALDEDVDLDFIETPLCDVVEFIADTHRIECHLDRRALDDVGISSDALVTRSVKGIPLRSALRLILADLDLTCITRDEVLLITTFEVAESTTTVGLYPVADLVPCQGEEGETWDDYDTLIRIITNGVQADSWNSVGGPGSIVAGQFADAKLLVVSQTEAVHQQITKLLADLRKVASESSNNPQLTGKHRARPRESNTNSKSGGGFF